MKKHCSCEAHCECDKPEKEKNKISKVKDENLSKRKSSKGTIGGDSDSDKLEK
jgi:hypothetical protein